MAAQFSNTQVGNPAQFDALLTKRSATVSTRNIVANPVTITNTRNGVTTRRQTVQFSLAARTSGASTKLGTVGVRDQISGFKQEVLPILDRPNGWSVTVPEWFVQFPVLNEASSIFGPCMQSGGARETCWTINGSQVIEETFMRPSQYEFFITNPFPTSFTAQQVADAIGGCKWVILRGMTLQFAVTPERVLQDIQRTNRTINSVALLQDAVKITRTYDEQPADRLQNIFPRLEVVGDKLVNTSIINGRSWVGQRNIKSGSGQTLTWSWVVGVFNDTDNDGPWSTQMGPMILDIKRSDWEFFDWNDAQEFILVASTTERPRIDRVTKTIYYNPSNRLVFSLQLRQASTDKGEDYAGYTAPAFNFYSDALGWFLKNTYGK